VLVRGVDIETLDRGHGRPFFWGHGLMGSMAQEDGAELLDWDELAACGRLVRFDARGHGRSEATLDPAGYRWSELARDLLALADACGEERAVWGGASMGCATALHAAVAAPERTDALVLVIPPTAWKTRPRQARIYRGMAKMVDALGLAPLRWMVQLGGLARVPEPLAQMQRSFAESLRRADRRAVAAAMRGAAASDLPPPDALATCEVPALVLAWRGDPAHPVATAERLGELLPQADVRIADGLDDVRGWTGAIRSFLAEHEPARSGDGGRGLPVGG
jgi:pimeloyl-ACP methyl ester carboxylesterase